jgi:UPF0716 protein FxsA
LRLLLILIVLVFPFAEIWGLVLLARAFGSWFLLYLVCAALLGIFIIRRERARMGPRMKAFLAGGTSPLPALLYTFRYLTAGILLVIPGVLSDIAAIVLLLLPTRPEQPDAPAAGPGPQVIEGEFHKVEAANESIELADDELP